MTLRTGARYLSMFIWQCSIECMLQQFHHHFFQRSICNLACFSHVGTLSEQVDSRCWWVGASSWRNTSLQNPWLFTMAMLVPNLGKERIFEAMIVSSPEPVTMVLAHLRKHEVATLTISRTIYFGLRYLPCQLPEPFLVVLAHLGKHEVSTLASSTS